LRIQRGQNEVKVMVRYPEADRRTMATIDRMRLRTAGGLEVPFRQAAFIAEGRGYSTISRTNRRRVVTVTTLLDKDVSNPDEMLADLRHGVLRELTADYPGLSYDLEGSSRDQRESMQGIQRAFVFGLILIFAVLAVPFRSFLQPLVVMSAIPFGIVGAVLGHLLLGYNLSMISVFGLIALTGVVVNSSLVLIDFINRARRAGVPVDEAVKQAGMRRFRPIVMTAITTFVGLAPIIAETSLQARFLIPMAISLGFGVLFATGVTLVLVPTLYMILEDVLRLFRGKSPASVSDAAADPSLTSRLQSP
jgi:multidrug efflux pump subunit AcrB